MARSPRTRRQRLKRWMAWLLAACGALLLLGTLGLHGAGAFAIGSALALAPVPLYVLVLLAFDRFEPEPPRLLGWAFAWGALGATFLAGFANDLGGQALAAWTGGPADALVPVAVAPVVEELLKGALVLALFRWKRDEFDGPIDGMTYAAMAALGFATVENLMYYAEAAVTGGAGGATGLFVLRGLIGGLNHPLYTAMTGIGLGLAVGARSRGAAVAWPLAGLAAAVTLHSMWNAGATAAAATGGVSFLLALATVVAALAVTGGYGLRALRAEGRRIAEHLAPDAAAGLVDAEALVPLGRLFGRTGAAARALRRGGVRAWRAQRAFHRAASEEGLRRWRHACGREADGAPRHDYLPAANAPAASTPA